MKRLAGLLLLLPLWAGAAEYWVDLAGTGTGAADGSDVNNLCAGFADVDCPEGAGDTVYVCNAGTANTNPLVSGSEGSPVVYDWSCPGGTPATLTVGGATALGINRSYVTHKNATISTTTANACIYMGASTKADNITIQDSTIGPCGSIGVQWDGSTGGATNVLFDNVTITGATRAIAITSSIDTAVGPVTIRNSTLSNNSLDGVALLGSGGYTISKLEIDNTVIDSNGDYGIYANFASAVTLSEFVLTDSTITNNNAADPGSSGGGVVVSTIEGGTYDGGILGTVKVIGNTISGNEGHGLFIAGKDSADEEIAPAAWSGEAIITDNYVHHNGLVGSNAVHQRGLAGGINGGGYGSGLIARNYVHDVATYGCGISGTRRKNVIIEDNVVHTVTRSYNTPDGCGIFIDQWDDNVTVRGNYVYDINVYTEGQPGTSKCYGIYRATNSAVVGNVCRDSAQGVTVNGNITDGNIVANNSFDNISIAGIRQINGLDTPATSARVYNNTITNCGTGVLIMDDADFDEWDHNNIYDCETAYDGQAAGANDISSDPLFIGGSSPTTAEGFRLRADSPARYAGTYLGPMQDYGNRRFKVTPSIGAYESASGDLAGERTVRD